MMFLATVSQQAMIAAGAPLSTVKAQASFDTTDGRLAVADESGNDAFFVFRGDAAISSAQANLGSASLRLDGSGDYVEVYGAEGVADDVHFAVPGQPATVEFFFRAEDAAVTETLFCCNDSTFADDIKIAMVSGALWAQLYNAGSGVLNLTGGTLVTGTWHHCAAVWDGTSLTLYLDGASVGTGTPSSAVTTNDNPMLIGRDARTTSQDFHGNIEGFRFSKSAVFTANFTPPIAHYTPERTKAAPANPSFANVAHLAGWEGADAATTYTDESSQSPALGFDSSGVEIDTAQARFGLSSLFFDGTNGFVTIAHSSAVSLAAQSAFTVEAWVRPDATALTKNSAIFNKRDGAGAEEFRLSNGAGTAIDFVSFAGGNVRANARTRDGLLVADTWVHVAGVRDGNRYMAFVNGELEGTDYTAGSVSANTAPVRIGSSAFNTGRDWSGHIDETRISTEVFYPSIGFLAPTVPYPRASFQLFTDNFNRPDENLEDSADWDRIGGSGGEMGVRSNAAAMLAGTDGPAYVCPDLNQADQFAEAIFSSSADANYFLACRVQDANNFIGVRKWTLGGDRWSIYKRVAGTFTELALAEDSSLAAGNVKARLEVIGDTARLYVDESLYLETAIGAHTAATRTGFIVRNDAFNPAFEDFRAGAISSFSSPVDTLLVSFDGVDQATTAVDQGIFAAPLTFANGAKLDAGQAKFGSTSLLLDGSDDGVTLPHRYGYAIPRGDFTIEMWVRPRVSASGLKGLLTKRTGAGADFSLWLDSNRPRFFIWPSSTGIDITSSVAATIADWNHIAVTREGTAIKIWLNGVEVASGTTSFGYDFSTQQLLIGDDDTSSGRHFDGNIQEMRITLGLARYAAAFTPPTTSFVP
ncbi:putative tail protein [Erythrobacter phage vB_EliS-L02]|nr:putative tail protein [Erythrobacter phage vB_EliS-L02]